MAGACSIKVSSREMQGNAGRGVIYIFARTDPYVSRARLQLPAQGRNLAWAYACLVHTARFVPRTEQEGGVAEPTSTPPSTQPLILPAKPANISIFDIASGLAS